MWVVAVVGGYDRGRVGSWECVVVEMVGMIAGVGVDNCGGEEADAWLQTVINHGGEGASRLPMVGNCGGE